MKFPEYLREECVQTGSAAPDKPAALREIARLAKQCDVLQHVSEDDILQGLTEREALGSTGFGGAIAIPHCALDGIAEFVVGALITPQGVDFEALDEQPTKLFVFIIAPREKKNEHIQVLSRVSSVLRMPEHVREIIAGPTPQAIRESMLRHLPLDAEIEAKKAYKQFTVVVQHEDVFTEILAVFTEIPDCFVSVLEASNASKYLYALPLFAHFWNEERKGFNRMIWAVVPASLSNEAIRRVNMILENLEEQGGVLVVLQDIEYLNGSLNLS